MRLVERLPASTDGTKPLTRTKERDHKCAQHWTIETTDALAARKPIDTSWNECLRQYEGVPKDPTDAPIEGAPNIEVTLGAIAADAIYAQFIDLVFNIQPPVTARPTGNTKEDETDVKALQRRINHGVASEWGIRPAVEQACLDTTQLGTGFLYCPYVEHVRKTDILRTEFRGPLIQAWPIEDVIVPGGAGVDVQTIRWIGIRSWLTESDLKLRARPTKKGGPGWDTSSFTPVAGQDWVRSQRERMGQTRLDSAAKGALYEVVEIFAHYDYDDDGEDEDLYIVFDRGSGTVGLVAYNPYDTRPFAVMRYQLRAYLFYGLGILEMTRPYQETTTKLGNHYLINVMLANARMWAGKEGVVDANMPIYPNKVVPLPNPDTDLKPLQMGEIYPSLPNAIAMQITFAERRVGLGSNEMSVAGKPSSLLGNRTPGITALSFLQQVNRRFTPAFDNMRLAASEAVRQCLYREQELLLADDEATKEYLERILGFEDAARVIRLLRDPRFDDAVSVELTASSASVNREADRQAFFMLVGVLGQYYERILQLVQIAATPNLPEPIRDTAKMIAEAGGELIKRGLMTLDQIKDPNTFIINVEEQIDALAPQMPQGGLEGLAGVIGQMFGGGGGAGAPPALPSPNGEVAA